MSKRIELSKHVAVSAWDMEVLQKALKNGSKYVASIAFELKGVVSRVYKEGAVIYADVIPHGTNDVVVAKVSDLDFRDRSYSVKMFQPGSPVSVLVASPEKNLSTVDAVVGLSRIASHKANRVEGVVKECISDVENGDELFEYLIQLENGDVFRAGIDDVQELIEGVEYNADEMSEYEVKALLDHAISRRLEVVIDYQKYAEEDTTRRCVEPIKINSSRANHSSYTLVAFQINNFDSNSRKTDHVERKFYLSCIKRLVITKTKYVYDPDIHDVN